MLLVKFVKCLFVAVTVVGINFVLLFVLCRFMFIVQGSVRPLLLTPCRVEQLVENKGDPKVIRILLWRAVIVVRICALRAIRSEFNKFCGIFEQDVFAYNKLFILK